MPEEMSKLVNAISPRDARSKKVKGKASLRKEGENVMSEQFSQAVAAAQRLPDETQKSIMLERIESAQQLSNDVRSEELERILDEIDEMEWDAIVAKPHVKQRLRELGRQAREDHLAGRTTKGGFGGI